MSAPWGASLETTSVVAMVVSRLVAELLDTSTTKGGGGHLSQEVVAAQVWR